MPDSQPVRFGIFAFDPATRELWRDGMPVRLQAQPAQALALLIAHAGEVVTRDTLRHELWGEETFVDFDRGLNFCIAQIRGALGDSADSPRFVRTLPKRGYQFIVPVSQSADAPTLPPVAKASRRKPILVAAAVAAIVIAAGISWWLARPKPVPPSITIAVTRFDNETGDDAYTRLADTLTDSVVAELTESGGGRYGVIGNAAILRAPRQGRDLRVIGAVLNAGYIVMGQVQRDGDAIRILAHLIRLPSLKHLAVVRSQSAPQLAEQRQSDLARHIAAEFARHLDAEHSQSAASSTAAIH
jgi:DNA-binding winged helix-turn-helix (wHTH) protein/TolB-like protein